MTAEDYEPSRGIPGSALLEGQVHMRRHSDGRVVVEQAPPTATMSLDLLAQADHFLVRVSGNRITLAGQVTYRVVGWDGLQSALVLERDDSPGPGVSAESLNFPPGAGTKGT